MPLTISLVTSEADIPRIAEIDYEGWHTPYNPQLKHFRPILPTRDDYIAWSLKREWLDPTNPNVFLVKCVNTDQNLIIGYAKWEVNEGSDAKGGVETTKAEWHVEGSEDREFAQRFVDGLEGFIGERVRRPHIELHAIVVHPEHRGCGAGRMLIRWGTDKADELGIETAISSLPFARGAYEKCGLGCIEVIPPNPELKVENPSERWKELQKDDLSGWLMWRPIGHDYVEGVDKAPWLS